MNRLLQIRNNYADTARILNEKAFKTGDGLALTSIAVGYVRKVYGLKSRFDRLRERGMLTISEMAKACGVSINTIGHWRQKGLIRAHAINDRSQFLFEDPIHRRSTSAKSGRQSPDARFNPESPAGEVGPPIDPGDGAGRHLLGRSRQRTRKNQPSGLFRVNL